MGLKLDRLQSFFGVNIEIDLEAITIDLNTLSMNRVLRYKINDFIDHVIVLSMFLILVCGLFEWCRICAGFLLFVYICISIGDLINRFNTATFVCLFHARTWISNIICHGLFVISE